MAKQRIHTGSRAGLAGARPDRRTGNKASGSRTSAQRRADAAKRGKRR